MSEIATALINLITWGNGAGGNLQKNGEQRKLLKQGKREKRSKTSRKDERQRELALQRAAADSWRPSNSIKTPRLGMIQHPNSLNF